MSDILDPDLVLAGIAFLDDEKSARLWALFAALAMRRLREPECSETYADLVTDFLLWEVGMEELRAQHQLWQAFFAQRGAR
jgi:hypothetical protein